MTPGIETTSPIGMATMPPQSDFSLTFEDAWFSALPAACMCLLVVVIGSFSSKSALAQDHRQQSLVLSLSLLAPLHIASLGVYCLIPTSSVFHSRWGLLGYSFRAVAWLFSFAAYLRMPSRFRRTIGVSFLLVAVFDAVRVHTLWTICHPSSRDALENALCGLQVTVLAAPVIQLLYEAVKPRASPVKHISTALSEEKSSTLGRLLFGWVWPLLSFGKSHKIISDDLQGIEYHSYASHREYMVNAPRHQARQFYSVVVLQYSGALLLALLQSLATLCQPFIIEGVVKFLQSDQSVSVGVWLVVAMFVDLLAISVFKAHSSHITNQVNYRVRSYLTHKIFQRSLSPTSGNESAEKTSSKASVHVSTDINSCTNGTTVVISVISNTVVVVVGCYMLHAQIGLAFLAPLTLALVGTVVPISLSPMMGGTQKAAREATETRVQSMKQVVSDARNVRIGSLQNLTAEQVAQFRDTEIERETEFRSVLVIVAVTALSLNTMCILSAFGFFSLSNYNLDYARLFSSLSILEIMVAPLLMNIQNIPMIAMSWVSWSRIQKYINNPSNFSILANRSSSSGVDVALPPSFRDDEDASYLLKLDTANVGWTEDESVLKNICLSLMPGNVVIINGTSASGKSSLLKCVLGEGRVHSGYVDLRATRVAFCDQKPWFVPEMSIRDNIILGDSFDRKLFDAVVNCCCLGPDLAKQDKGDASIVDSKGTSLSGGQRARLALARALYREADILLLDEVFAGLDRTTAAQIADNLFGRGGYLSSRPNLAVLMVSTVVPPSLVDRPNIRLFRLESGTMTSISDSLVSVVAGVDDQIPSNETAEIKQDSDGVVTNSSNEIKDSKTEDPDEIGSAGDEYLAYFQSFGSWALLGFVVVLLILWVGIDKGSTYWLTRWTNSYYVSPRVDVGFYIGIYAALGAANVIVLTLFVRIHMLKLMPSSSLTFHRKMLNVFLKSPASEIETTSSQIINRFTQDLTGVDVQLPMSFLNFALGLFAVIGAVIVIGIGTPYAIIFVAILAPPLYILQRYYLATSTQLRTMQLSAQAPILGTLNSSIDGRITIRAFSIGDRMTQYISDQIYQAQRPAYLFHSIQTWLSMSLDLGSIFLITAVTILLVTIRNNDSIGLGGLALLNAVGMTSEIKIAVQSWANVEISMASVKRILSYIKFTPVEDVDINKMEPSPDWPSKGNIELDRLTLAYTDREVVRDVSLKIASGNKIAILGRTGSGKTSLMQSFFGLIRFVRGGVHIDGVELSSVCSQTLRSRLVGNPQQTFSNGMATVRRNLDPSQELSDDEIRAAIKRVIPEQTVRDDIMSKLDSRWEDCSFSAGWQKRIGLARTVLRKSAVYIFDEPTSGMDEESHDAIMDCIFKALADKTVIVITHTVKGIERFDQVAVMADGKLAESASPAELLADSSSQLYKYVHSSSASSSTPTASD